MPTVGLNGIDISSWQDDLVVSNMSTCVFVIVKATGGIDGAPDDQTGRESRIQDYYRDSWDGVLHYNGKADSGGAPGGSGSGAPSDNVSECVSSSRFF